MKAFDLLYEGELVSKPTLVRWSKDMVLVNVSHLSWISFAVVMHVASCVFCATAKDCAQCCGDKSRIGALGA